MSDSDMTNLMLPRRRFVKGLALGGVLATMPSVLRAGQLSPHTRLGSAPVLQGSEINLVVGQSPRATAFTMSVFQGWQ